MQQRSSEDAALVTERLREQGYDGVVLQLNSGVLEVMVIEPSQVKSATSNTGAFDGNNDKTRYSRPVAKPAKPSHTREIEKGLSKTLEKLRRRIPVRVVGVAPETYLNDPDAAGVDGVYDYGRIILFTQNIADAKQANKVLRHEAFGHFGMQQILGDQFKPTLDQVRKLRSNKIIAPLVQVVRNRYPKLDTKSDAFQGELIAVMAEERVKLPVMRRILVHVRARNVARPERTSFSRPLRTREAYKARIDALFDGAKPNNTAGVDVSGKTQYQLVLPAFNKDRGRLPLRQRLEDGATKIPEHNKKPRIPELRAPIAK